MWFCSLHTQFPLFTTVPVCSMLKFIVLIIIFRPPWRTFSLLLNMLPSLSIIRDVSGLKPFLNYSLDKFVCCIVIISNFHLLQLWFKLFSCQHILRTFFKFVFVYCSFCLVCLFINLPEALFLSSNIIWHSSSHQLFLCLSSFPIIFPAASFIPLWIMSHISVISSTSSEYFVHVLLPPWWIRLLILSYLVYHCISLLTSLNFQSNFGPY